MKESKSKSISLPDILLESNVPKNSFKSSKSIFSTLVSLPCMITSTVLKFGKMLSKPKLMSISDCSNNIREYSSTVKTLLLLSSTSLVVLTFNKPFPNVVVVVSVDDPSTVEIGKSFILNNDIKSLSVTAFEVEIEKLFSVKLVGNPFNCDEFGEFGCDELGCDLFLFSWSTFNVIPKVFKVIVLLFESEIDFSGKFEETSFKFFDTFLDLVDDNSSTLFVDSEFDNILLDSICDNSSEFDKVSSVLD
ncbi:hypothetical protein C1645_748293, partial [Glomus cerebriforme]